MEMFTNLATLLVFLCDYTRTDLTVKVKQRSKNTRSFSKVFDNLKPEVQDLNFKFIQQRSSFDLKVFNT